jgi:hypothetical protein
MPDLTLGPNNKRFEWDLLNSGMAIIVGNVSVEWNSTLMDTVILFPVPAVRGGKPQVRMQKFWYDFWFVEELEIEVDIKKPRLFEVVLAKCAIK